MTSWTLVRRSLRFHASANLGVVLGATVGSAALIGALVVGDSVRESLRQRALERLANAHFALAPSDRLFTSELVNRAFPGNSSLLRGNSKPGKPGTRAGAVSLLMLPGTASRPGGEARANHVSVFGVTDEFWRFAGIDSFTSLSKGEVLINESLARQLGVAQGDQVLLRISRSEQLSVDSPIAPRGNQSAAFPARVARVLSTKDGGDLELRSGGVQPLNAFVRADDLWTVPELKGKANLILVGELTLAGKTEALTALNDVVRHAWALEDVALKLQRTPDALGIELRSGQVFLDPQIVTAANNIGASNRVSILTYLANLISTGTNVTPYSMVAAAGPPYTPAEMRDDEILLTQWLAEDLGVKAGEGVSLIYFDPESGAGLIEHTNVFRVRAVVPMELPWADRTLMPDFPGIEKAENARDWDAGFPLVHKIRPKDEEYWKEHRGTPKAFITLAAGQKMWANRFGALTAIRFPNPPGMPPAANELILRDQLLNTINPAEVGLRFEPVREEALKAAAQSQDFGQLFLGFSIFIVVSALLLMGLLFQFAMEQRAAEIGTLLSLGFTARQVRRLLLLEGAALSMVGGIAGALGGLGYARAMLWGLTTIWRGAVGASTLQFHPAPASLFIGFCASGVVACFTIWLTLRKQARQPAQELLAGKVQTGKPGAWQWTIAIAWITGAAALALVIWAVLKKETANAEIFFGAGTLLLVSGLATAAVWLNVLARRVSADRLSMKTLAVRSCGRRRKRSLATLALLASGCFVIIAISAFRLEAGREAERPTSGTGGFALFGQSTLPLAQNLNTESGREAFGLASDDLAGVKVVAMRVRAGDEASCLNLNRAQSPRLLGVRPELLADRFTFAKAEPGLDIHQGWRLLSAGKDQKSPNTPPALPNGSIPEIPAIGDANSIQWALGKKIGDTLDYTDEQGRAFKLRLVAAVANSILQGSLIIDEAEFVQRFPGQSGYKMFLLDVPPKRVSDVSRILSRALQDTGLELTSTVQRLDAFNAVQNTYLGTFQVLGGLGLLIGSAGLGVVVLRNVLERRAELGLFLAMGFPRRWLKKLVLTEHGALLGLGLGIGITAAAVAVLPALLSPGGHLPYISLAVMLSVVLVNGFVWTWVAIRFALRGDLLKTLRDE